MERSGNFYKAIPVSYTHLDVYKRQEVSQPKTSKKKKTVKKAVTAKSTPPKPKVTVTPTAPTLSLIHI